MAWIGYHPTHSQVYALSSIEVGLDKQYHSGLRS